MDLKKGCSLKENISREKVGSEKILLRLDGGLRDNAKFNSFLHPIRNRSQERVEV